MFEILSLFIVRPQRRRLIWKSEPTHFWGAMTQTWLRSCFPLWRHFLLSAANIPLLNCTADVNPSTCAMQAWADELSCDWCTERLKGANLSRLSALCPNTDVLALRHIYFQNVSHLFRHLSSLISLTTAELILSANVAVSATAAATAVSGM